METKLYVGNLSYNATEEDLKGLFAQHGTVLEVSLIRDSYSGQSKGFAFVKMEDAAGAEKALSLDGSDLLGRNIRVSEAKPQNKERGSSGGGGRGGFGGGNSRGGGGYGGGGGRDRY